MELTESTFSGMSDQITRDKEVQQSEIEQSIQEEETPNDNNREQSKEAPGSQIRQTSNGANDSSGEHKLAMPRSLSVNYPNSTSQSKLKPPGAPQRNVIPSRRSTFENTPGPAFLKHGAEVSHTPETSLHSQANIPHKIESQENKSDTNAESPANTENNRAEHTSEQLTYAEQLNQQTEFTEPAPLPATYHDTSAAEAAWNSAREDDTLTMEDTHILAAAPQMASRQKQAPVIYTPEELAKRAATAAIETRKMATLSTPLPPVTQPPATPMALTDIPTTPLPAFIPTQPITPQKPTLTRSKALLLLALLAIILVNASVNGFSQFFGTRGWGSVLSGSGNGGANLLSQLSQQLQHSPTPGSKGKPAPPTPAQIVNLLMSNMTLDDKLGQMMMIQFAGQSYSPDLDTMISQYHVGSVLYFQFNIGNKTQLTELNAQFQHNANLPMLIAVDQEGGTVDRLTNLDGPQPSASQIGASNNPKLAYQQGLKDARDLASYGFNLNLAPVVDVNNVYNPQLYERTFGNNPTAVTQMAEKYLEGLQQSGKVLGTLKHFPGLGDVSTDPHYGLPALTRSLSSLNAIDWAPYQKLINQGHVYSIMVTHEIVDALDRTEPSSLSPQVIGVLRNQMHFQGVIITDSLTMDSIHNFYTYGEAAAKAVEAGDDILMGADSPETLAEMITGIKQAMNSGAITPQQIDASVRRILLFKYEMGLLHV